MVTNKAANSASAVEYITNFVISAMVIMGVLKAGELSSLERNMWDPERLQE